MDFVCFINKTLNGKGKPVLDFINKFEITYSGEIETKAEDSHCGQKVPESSVSAQMVLNSNS